MQQGNKLYMKSSIINGCWMLSVSAMYFAEAHSREDVFQAFISGCH